MNRLLLLVLIAFISSSCDRKQDHVSKTPAQWQIDEYRAKIKFCQNKREANTNEEIKQSFYTPMTEEEHTAKLESRASQSTIAQNDASANTLEKKNSQPIEESISNLQLAVTENAPSLSEDTINDKIIEQSEPIINEQEAVAENKTLLTSSNEDTNTGNAELINTSVYQDVQKSETQASATTNSPNVADINAIAPETESHKDITIVLGNPNSKIVIKEYFSLTCPHCAYFHKNIFPELKKRYIDTNKVRYEISEFVGNKQDFEASVLSRCSGDNSKTIKFFDVLLAQQESWAFNKNFKDILTNIGQVGGISPQQFANCLQDQNLLNFLMNNTKIISNTPGFLGTPAFVINEKLFLGGFSASDLGDHIDSLLKEISKH